MAFESYIPRSGLYKHQESSSLDSLRERNSLMHQWRSQRQGAGRSDKQNQVISQLRTQVARLSKRAGTGEGLHPFKIYNFPSSLRRFPVSDDWRRFKVRDGVVGFRNGSLSGTANGSDGVTNDGFSGDGSANSDTYFGWNNLQQIPPTNASQWVGTGAGSTWNEFSVPVDHQVYWFWFSFILPNAAFGPGVGVVANNFPQGIAVCPESDLTKAKIMLTGDSFDATKIWPSMPLPDPYNIPIGSVRIDDGAFNAIIPGWPKVTINQVLYDSLILDCSPYGTDPAGLSSITMRYRGDYSNTQNYYVGDTVTIIYADSTGVQSLYHYVYDPPQNAGPYNPIVIPGALSGISPNGNSPIPWKLLSKSPKDADYHVDATYQAAKAYLHT